MCYRIDFLFIYKCLGQEHVELIQGETMPNVQKLRGHRTNEKKRIYGHEQALWHLGSRYFTINIFIQYGIGGINLNSFRNYVYMILKYIYLQMILICSYYPLFALFHRDPNSDHIYSHFVSMTMPYYDRNYDVYYVWG